MKRLASEALGDVVGRLREQPYSPSTHVRFVVEGREFHAHRWLVEMRLGKYAHAMQAGFAEGQQSAWPVEGHAADTFEQLIIYLYNDRCDYACPEADDEEIIALWRLADELLFARLCDQCQQSFSAADDEADRCLAMLLAARAAHFPPAEETAWQSLEQCYADFKSEFLTYPNTDTYSPRHETEFSNCFLRLEQALFEGRTHPLTDEEMIRFNQLFLHWRPLADPFRQLQRAGNNAALLETIPVHILPLDTVVEALDGRPADIGAATTRRFRYLRELALRPRTVSRTPLDKPLQFMLLSRVEYWSKIDFRDGLPRYPPASLAFSTHRIEAARPASKPVVYVADYPSVEFGMRIKWRKLGVPERFELGVWSLPAKRFSASLAAEVSMAGVRLVSAADAASGEDPPVWTRPDCQTLTLRIRVERSSDGTLLASLYRDGCPMSQSLLTNETEILPAISVGVQHATSLKFETFGQRWPHALGPLAADRALIPECAGPRDNKVE